MKPREYYDMNDLSYPCVYKGNDFTYKLNRKKKSWVKIKTFYVKIKNLLIEGYKTKTKFVMLDVIELIIPVLRL